MNALRISREDLDSGSDTDFDKAEEVNRPPLQEYTNRDVPHRAKNLGKLKPEMDMDRYESMRDMDASYNHMMDPSEDHGRHQVRDSNYHQPQVIDEDVENFTTRLDTAIMRFRSETIGDFMKIKRHLLQEQAQNIAREKAKCDALLAAKQNEIENLKEMLMQTTSRSEKFEHNTQSLAQYSGKLKHSIRQITHVHRIVSAWKMWAKRKKGNFRRVQNFTGRRKYLDLKIVFAAWGREHRKNLNTLRNEKCDKKIRDKASELSMRYGKEVDTLRTKLEETETTLHTERRDRFRIVEELKKSMLRQMCAFNYESMNILNPNGPTFPSAPNMTGIPTDSMSLQNMTPSRVGFEETPKAQYKETPQSSLFSHDPSTQVPDMSTSGVKELSRGEIVVESKDHKWQPAPIVGHQLDLHNTFGKTEQAALRGIHPQTQMNPHHMQTQPSSMHTQPNMMHTQPNMMQAQPNMMQAPPPSLGMPQEGGLPNFNSMKSVIQTAKTTNTDLHTTPVEELMNRYRPQTASQPQTQIPEAPRPMTAVPMGQYRPTIEVDNAVRAMPSEECKAPGSVASSLPEVTSSQGSGKTIRVNAGKSYVSSQAKKAKTKPGTTRTVAAGKRVMK